MTPVRFVIPMIANADVSLVNDQESRGRTMLACIPMSFLDLETRRILLSFYGPKEMLDGTLHKVRGVMLIESSIRPLTMPN